MALIYGIHPIESLLKTKPAALKQVYFLQMPSNARLQSLQESLKKSGVSTQLLEKDAFLTKLPRDAVHQSVCAEIVDASVLTENHLPDMLEQAGKQAFFLVLDGVQDPHNLGACLRTANAAGVTAVIAPKDKACGLTPVVRKVACGAENYTPFVSVTNLARTLRLLKDHGVWVIGTDDGATQSIFNTDFKGPIALVMGAEGEGLRRLTRETCDLLIRIPMQGAIPSLNVSAATAICLFEALRHRV